MNTMPSPACATASWATNACSGNSGFKVSATRSATPGTYTLTISGASGNLSHSTTVGLTIQ